MYWRIIKRYKYCRERIWVNFEIGFVSRIGNDGVLGDRDRE